VQLHRLTPNSIVHITGFITLCESFLGVEPHWTLWKFLFCLCPSVSLLKNPELGGAVVSVCAEVYYLEFSMVALVQGWRKNGSTSRTRKLPPLINLGLPLLRLTEVCRS
jgi:hypothetical protein